MIYLSEKPNDPHHVLTDYARATGRKSFYMLWTDGPVDELHAFARRLGLDRRWFGADPRLPRYDVAPSLRKAALLFGAVSGQPGLFLHGRENAAPEKGSVRRIRSSALSRHLFRGTAAAPRSIDNPQNTVPEQKP